MPEKLRIGRAILRLYTLLTILTAGCHSEPTALPPLPPVQQTALEPVRGEKRALKELVIVWSAEVKGELLPCGCPTVPYGGLARKAEVITRFQKQPAPVFVLDAGELLLKGSRGSDSEATERARAVLKGSEAAGLDAWAPSSRDQSAGIGLGGRALFGDKLATVLERGGVRLGVVAAPSGEGRLEAMRVAIKAAGEADLWVALVNGGEGVAAEVAEALPELGLVLSCPGEESEAPKATKGATILEMPARGRYLSVVRVFVGTKPGPVWVPDDSVQGVWERADRLWREAFDGKVGVEVERMALQPKLEEAVGGWNVGVIWEKALGSELEGDAAVAALVEKYQQERLLRAVKAAERPEAEERYGTVGACVSCHQDRFVAWGFDPHAKALLALADRGATQNPECLACHTTAWGKPGGIGGLEEVDRFKGVQCEACHGPMGGHPENGRKSEVISEGTCTGCHDAANSPGFEYGKYVGRVSCSR